MRTFPTDGVWWFCKKATLTFILAGFPCVSSGQSVPHRFWTSGQINIIHQQHSAFPARYDGMNSLKSSREKAISRLLTLYTGLAISNRTEALLDIESAG